MTPWCNSTLFVGASYDAVRYKRFEQGSKRESGVGAIVDFTQTLFCNYTANVRYEYKQIYNFIEGSINWNKSFAYGDLGIGVFGNHVWGKRELPSSSTAGIELSFTFGICECHLIPVGNFGGCDPCCPEPCLLRDWVAVPAVCMPQVLAIADNTSCQLPS